MKNRVFPAEIVTGLSDFDALAGPMPRGRITVAAAPPSAGATAFALGVARHNGELGHQALFASFESGTDTIMRNLVAATTSVTPTARSRSTRGAAHASNMLVRRWSSPGSSCGAAR
ncbi:DnaB helicase C-terminal domain-containing protein (plasmid) [Streptomyces phaeoluteigriseus]|uniref:DnaB helicase C-terminal domain-containing protein n=1 Tax=Streptomyces phaeoluteigriseus TaxID=114686 RepID=A0ABY4ZLU8_9ACTN|nr:DnaB helicase C-terminal domain-containing protein [Streptomyces phaeoluteigriseus]USQ89867.1 DnaB helicase C-terminal domain-containing protein [Streptomyces phaeoluteigriseus]